LIEDLSGAPLYCDYGFPHELHSPEVISANNIMSNPLRVANTEKSQKWRSDTAIMHPSSMASFFLLNKFLKGSRPWNTTIASYGVTCTGK